MKYTPDQHRAMAAALRDLAAKETDPKRRADFEMRARSFAALAKLAAHRLETGGARLNDQPASSRDK
jgi:hypothetical protein